MDLKRSNPGSFCENPNLEVPLPSFCTYAPENLKIFWKIIDLGLESNEFHHDSDLKMCFLRVILGTNEIVSRVLSFALLSMTCRWQK